MTAREFNLVVNRLKATTVVIDYFTWQLFRSVATKSDTQAFHGGEFSLIYITGKHLVTHVTDRRRVGD